MSKGTTRQVNFSLHLRPETSKADERVIRWLKQWHEEVKQGNDDRNNANMEIRAFHRRVYLAGLQLQLLEPQLCNAIAESIGSEALTLPELVGKLVRDNLLPEGVPMNGQTAGASAEHFSDVQLGQLKSLLEERTAAMPVASSEAAGDHAEFVRLHAELDRMKTLLNQQTRLLQQLQRQGVSAPVAESKESGTEESDVSAISAPSEKMQKIKQKGIF
jgi:hypothetical protein